MSKGDVVSDLQSIAGSAFLDIRPGSGREWVINNLFFEGPVEFYWSDGVNNLLWQTEPSAGRIGWEVFHSNHTFYLRIKNTGASPISIGYSGIILK